MSVFSRADIYLQEQTISPCVEAAITEDHRVSQVCEMNVCAALPTVRPCGNHAHPSHDAFSRPTAPIASAWTAQPIAKRTVSKTHGKETDIATTRTTCAAATGTAAVRCSVVHVCACVSSTCASCSCNFPVNSQLRLPPTCVRVYAYALCVVRFPRSRRLLR